MDDWIGSPVYLGLQKDKPELITRHSVHTAINTAIFFPTVIGVQSGIVPLLNAGLTWVAALIVSKTKVFYEGNDSD